MQIIHHYLATYGKISPAQRIQYEAEVTFITYDPTTPVDLEFDKIDDLFMFGEFAQCHYCQGVSHLEQLWKRLQLIHPFLESPFAYPADIESFQDSFP